MVLLAWLGINGADDLLTSLSIPLGAVELNPFLGAISLALTMSGVVMYNGLIITYVLL